MTSPTQDAAKPAGPAELIVRRLPEAVGIALALAGAALAAALATLPPAAGAAPGAAGLFDSATAATLHRNIGLASWLVCAWIAAWGWRIGSRRPIGRPARIVVAAPLALGLATVAVAAMFRHANAMAAGEIGDDLYATLVPAASALTGLGPQGIGILAAALATALAPSALGANTGFREILRRLASRRLVPSEINLTLPRVRLRVAGDADGAPEPGPVTAAPAATTTKKPSEKASGKADAAARETLSDLGPARKYELPSLDLLASPPAAKKPAAKDGDKEKEALAKRGRRLEAVLAEFGVKGEVVDARPGPVITLFELQPAPGVKAAQVVGLADDIARSMSAASARVAAIPGRTVIGIEIPNKTREVVALRELLEAKEFAKAKPGLVLALGKDIGGGPVVADLTAMPHLLIAGTTGSGKSVGINSIILSLVYRLTPDQCRFLMVDPKMLELAVYGGIPHLLAPVVTDPHEAVAALRWAVREMELRYKTMSAHGVRNVAGYNALAGKARAKAAPDGPAEPALAPMPSIVIVVDEIADLMLTAGKDVETAVQRITQMARAAGIHLVMATQRPSADVITGTIKANFPTRISFQVTSKIDSRTVLGEGGAELLLGKGDMLYAAGGGKMQRVHGAFVSDEEIEAVAEFLKGQGEPVYVDFDRNAPAPPKAAPPPPAEVEDEPEEVVEAEAVAAEEPPRSKGQRTQGGRGRKRRG